jgi:predicted LPLAT superfamily acyltransferase
MERFMTQCNSARRVQHWAQLNEFSFVAGMRLMYWICRVFGRWPFKALLYPVALSYMITKPTARMSSRDYVRRVAEFDKANQIKPGMFTVLHHFASFGESLLDRLQLWSGAFDSEPVELHGEEQIAAQVRSRRGGLLICSHLGNLDLCRVVAKRQAGLKLTILTHTKHATVFNRLLAQLDPESQLNLMQVTEISPATAILLSKKIAEGEFVAIAGDRIPVARNPKVVLAKFLGERAPFPVGPYILASLLQCPTYLLFSLRVGRAWQIHFELFREAIRLPRKNRYAALAQLVVDYVSRLEHFCVRTPLQWFNFYDFWRLPVMDTTDGSR